MNVSNFAQTRTWKYSGYYVSTDIDNCQITITSHHQTASISCLLLSSESNINCSMHNKIILRVTWIHNPSKGEISFFRLSLIIPYIFSRKAVSCCLNNNAGYLASTCRKSSSLPSPRPLRNDESPALWGDALKPQNSHGGKRKNRKNK